MGTILSSECLNKQTEGGGASNYFMPVFLILCNDIMSSLEPPKLMICSNGFLKRRGNEVNGVISELCIMLGYVIHFSTYSLQLFFAHTHLVFLGHTHLFLFLGHTHFLFLGHTHPVFLGHQWPAWE